MLIVNIVVIYYEIFVVSVTADIEDFSTFSFLDSQDKSAVIAKHMHYVTQEGNEHAFLLFMSKARKAKILFLTSDLDFNLAVYNSLQFNSCYRWATLFLLTSMDMQQEFICGLLSF